VRQERPWVETTASATMDSMTTKLEAVFENGVFRPLTRPEGIAEHGRVTLTVTSEDRLSSVADLAGRISADDAQEMRAIVEREFERVDLREWQ
jgi:hypothetical protein